MELGTHYSIDDTLTIPFQTRNSSGAEVDADALPTYQIYEQGGTTALSGLPAAAKRDDANTTGYYEAAVPLSTANGFEAGKSYTIRKRAVIGGVAVVVVDTFAITGAAPTLFAASPAGYPTTTDLEDRLVEAGITPPSSGTMQSALNAAIEAWERATEWKPFLNAASTTSTRWFSPKGSILDIGGLVAAPTTVTIYQSYTDAGVAEGGTVLVVNRDYVLLPHKALVEGRPYRYIKIVVGTRSGEPYRGHGGLRPRSISVLGPFGYATAVPADVYEAILRLAMAEMLRIAALEISGGLSSWMEGNVQEVYTNDPFGKQIAAHEAFAARVAGRYKRLRMA